MVNDLCYVDIKFPVSKMDHSKVEQKNSICINVFCYKNALVYPFHVSQKKFENFKNLLLIIDQNKLHYMYIKTFEQIYKKHFCRFCLQCFSSKKVLEEHEKVCFKINGKESVK